MIASLKELVSSLVGSGVFLLVHDIVIVHFEFVALEPIPPGTLEGWLVLGERWKPVHSGCPFKAVPDACRAHSHLVFRNLFSRLAVGGKLLRKRNQGLVHDAVVDNELTVDALDGKVVPSLEHSGQCVRTHMEVGHRIAAHDGSLLDELGHIGDQDRGITLELSEPSLEFIHRKGALVHTGQGELEESSYLTGWHPLIDGPVTVMERVEGPWVDVNLPNTLMLEEELLEGQECSIMGLNERLGGVFNQ
jgi:hypothetical protein